MYPSYIFLLGLSVTTTLILKHIIPIKEVLAHLFCLQSLYSAYHNLNGELYFIGHIWYLILDVILFLIWIVCFKFLDKDYTKTFLICAFIISVSCRTLCVFGGNYFYAYMNPIGQMDSFAIGGFLAYFTQNNNKTNIRMCFTILLVGLIGVVSCLMISAIKGRLNFIDAYISYHSYKGYMTNPITANVFLFIALLFAGIFLLALQHNLVCTLLSNKFLSYIGKLSYTAYIFHFPIIFCLRHLLVNKFVSILIALLFTMIISSLWQARLELLIMKIFK